ncbi:hypothetical protein ANN_09500 [Periplaneta americana]|uniref:Zinc finger protein-like 1 homolog n=1 Tax=Periplaneta americana TaxID=6978 RepID=A0ABQ8TLH5_PERAM|nr:hypothetical protein ANN_09500 [Periplaneta americana]
MSGNVNQCVMSKKYETYESATESQTIQSLNDQLLGTIPKRVKMLKKKKEPGRESDVYHWACLDQFSRQLPPTTAPAGYTCPSCKVGLFPANNLVSPVADVLREKLAGVNWARAGLGLPLLSEDHEQKPAGENRKLVTEDIPPVISNHVELATPPPSVTSSHSDVSNQRQSTPKRNVMSNAMHGPSNSVSNSGTLSGNPHSVVHVEDAMSAFSRTESFPVPGVREKPRKNLTQATHPDWESNLGPLGSELGFLTPQPQWWTFSS